MNSIIIAASLWFVSYQAIQGGQDMNNRPSPIGGDAHASKAECVKDGARGVKELNAHNPYPGAKWKYTCTLRDWKPKTQAELDAIHNGHH